MNRTTETKLHASLTEAIEQWWEEESQETEELPYVGTNVAELMAQAAMAVLAGMADLYETLHRNGELTDDAASG